MYNNKEYYLAQLKRAKEDAEADLNEAGSDFLHVTIDALAYLEKSIERGAVPWAHYNEHVDCYRVTVKPGTYTDVWAESLVDAVEQFKKDFPALEILSVVKQD